METAGDLVEGVEEEKVVIRTASKLSGMQLTERDLTILHFINDFGFCEMPQIETRFGLTKRRSFKSWKDYLQPGWSNMNGCFMAVMGCTG